MRLQLRCAVLVLAVLVTAVFPPSARGQRPGAPLDEQIVRDAQLVASGTRVDVLQHGVAADRALARMEELVGRKLDESTLGPRIRIYVSASATVSHVWRGYRHPTDPKPFVFLNPVVAGLAVPGTNATYAHELAHLLTWRYHSHTLREGLADSWRCSFTRAPASAPISMDMRRRPLSRPRSRSTWARLVRRRTPPFRMRSSVAPTTTPAIALSAT